MILEMSMGFIGEAMKSLNTQFMDLSSHPLNITKNKFLGMEQKRFATKKRLVNGEINPLSEKFEFNNGSGHFISKNDCYKPKNSESLLAIHSTTQTWIFWSWKMRKTTKNMKEKHARSSIYVREKMYG